MQHLQETGHSKICPHIAIIKNGKVLLGLRHYTPDKWKTISVWTTSGGRCDDAENVETALRREVAEEVGITDLNITDFLGAVDGMKDGDIVYLFAGTTNQEPQLLEPEKFSEWRWHGINEIPETFVNPKVFTLIKKLMFS